MLEYDEESVDELESGDVTGYAIHSGGSRAPSSDYGGHHYHNGEFYDRFLFIKILNKNKLKWKNGLFYESWYSVFGE